MLLLAFEIYEKRILFIHHKRQTPLNQQKYILIILILNRKKNTLTIILKNLMKKLSLLLFNEDIFT